MLQQAPAHTFAGPHTSAALYTVVPVHPALVLIVHAPVAVLQHTPAPQASGVHTPAGTSVEPGGQEAVRVIRHARVVLSQHAPAHGFDVQVVPGPWCWKFVPPQFAPVCNVHAPVVRLQQAPMQEFTGVHTVPGPLYMLEPHPLRFVGTTSAHAPVAGLQQAPMHTLGLQVVPLPWNVEPGGHAPAPVAVVHTPVRLWQHAPPHEIDVHVVPAPWNVLPAAQFCTSAASTHAPVTGSQHAPGVGHGFGRHVVPSPRYRAELAVQPICVVRMHVPAIVPAGKGVFAAKKLFSAQQAPWAHAPGAQLVPSPR